VINIYYWRITRYNPKNRDENGIYKKNDWTSVNDIGKMFNQKKLTFETYLLSEKAYINAILQIMNGGSIKSLQVESLEKNVYTNYVDFVEPESRRYYHALKNGMQISINDIPQLMRFVLREIVWCKLICDVMFVHFGYDYYMYVGSENQTEGVLSDIMSSGLFIEEMVSPYMKNAKGTVITTTQKR